MTTICIFFHLGNLRLESSPQYNFSMTPAEFWDHQCNSTTQKTARLAMLENRLAEEQATGQVVLLREALFFFIKTKKALIGQTQKCRYGKMES